MVAPHMDPNASTATDQTTGLELVAPETITHVILEADQETEKTPDHALTTEAKADIADKAPQVAEQFETITFESISVDAIDPQAQAPHKDEVFVPINIVLHNVNNCPAALKAKLDTGAQGCIVKCTHTISHQMVFLNLASSNAHQQCQLHMVEASLHSLENARLLVSTRVKNQSQPSLSLKPMDQP